jgi:hypothetical protein
MVKDIVQKRLGDRYADLADEVFNQLSLIKLASPAHRYFILEAGFKLGLQTLLKVLKEIKKKYFYRIKTNVLPQRDVEYTYIVLNSMSESAGLLLLLITFSKKVGKVSWLNDLSEFCIKRFNVLTK